MKVFYMDMKTNKKTTTADTKSKEHSNNHIVACEWYRQGDEVAIINAETGEVVVVWAR